MEPRFIVQSETLLKLLLCDWGMHIKPVILDSEFAVQRVVHYRPLTRSFHIASRLK